MFRSLVLARDDGLWGRPGMKVEKYIEDMKTHNCISTTMIATPQIYLCTSSLARTRDLMSATSTKHDIKVKEKNNAHDTHNAYSGCSDPWSGPGMTA